MLVISWTEPLIKVISFKIQTATHKKYPDTWKTKQPKPIETNLAWAFCLNLVPLGLKCVSTLSKHFNKKIVNYLIFLSSFMIDCDFISKLHLTMFNIMQISNCIIHKNLSLQYPQRHIHSTKWKCHPTKVGLL